MPSQGTRIKYTLLVNKLTIVSHPRPVQNPNHLSCQKWITYKERVAFSKLIRATKTFVQPNPAASMCTAENIISVHCTVQHDQKWRLDVRSLLPRLSCLKLLLVYNCAKTLPVQDQNLEVGKASKHSIRIWAGFVWLCVFGNKGQTGICFVETFQQHWNRFSNLLCPL